MSQFILAVFGVLFGFGIFIALISYLDRKAEERRKAEEEKLQKELSNLAGKPNLIFELFRKINSNRYDPWNEKGLSDDFLKSFQIDVAKALCSCCNLEGLVGFCHKIKNDVDLRYAYCRMVLKIGEEASCVNGYCKVFTATFTSYGSDLLMECRKRMIIKILDNTKTKEQFESAIRLVESGSDLEKILVLKYALEIVK